MAKRGCWSNGARSMASRPRCSSLLKNPELARDMGEAGRRRATEVFSPAGHVRGDARRLSRDAQHQVGKEFLAAGDRFALTYRAGRPMAFVHGSAPH